MQIASNNLKAFTNRGALDISGKTKEYETAISQKKAIFAQSWE